MGCEPMIHLGNAALKCRKGLPKETCREGGVRVAAAMLEIVSGSLVPSSLNHCMSTGSSLNLGGVLSKSWLALLFLQQLSQSRL